ncbi:hypothetical protein WA026_003894 [Henosepilachna vigintioctopunctata]|uniref:Protein takeout n=1 Tax=Henosepilachna vigintioctopunctata TaxID=420089 RepID=A0AAW1UG07_9CUCU
MVLLPFYLISVVAVYMVNGLRLPSYLKPCKVRTPTFSQCGVENGNAAIPVMMKGDRKFGFPSLNPLKVELIELSSGDLKLNGTNVLVKGLPEAQLTDIKANLDEQTIYLEIYDPHIELDFNYQVGGKISSLPVAGEGPAEIHLYNTTYKYKLDFTTYKKKGKDHAKFEKGDLNLEATKITLHFDNLFNGNKLLGDNINKFLNENWPQLLVDLRPGISGIVESVLKGVLVNIFDKVPMQEIFLDY